MTVKRIWHGWTEPADADTYERLLHDEVFPGIKAKKIPGYRRIELLRRDLGDEVEFITIMTFDTIQKVLKRWNQISDHFEVKAEEYYDKD